jgi:hypothetical protein
MEALLDGTWRDNDARRIAVLAENRGQKIGLLHLGRQASGRPAALDVEHHQWYFRHDGQSQEFGFQRHSGARGHSQGNLAAVGGADRHTGSGDLIFRLMNHAAVTFNDFGKFVRHRGCRCDRIHRADLHAGRNGAECGSLVAVHDDSFFIERHRVDMELEAEVCPGPGDTGFDQFDILLGHLGRLEAENVRNLPFNDRYIPLVDFRQHAQGEHVLAVAGVVDDLECFLLDRHQENAVILRGHLLHRIFVHAANFLVFMVLPAGLEQDDAIILQGIQPMAGQQHLIVEGNSQL